MRASTDQFGFGPLRALATITAQLVFTAIIPLLSREPVRLSSVPSLQFS